MNLDLVSSKNQDTFALDTGDDVPIDATSDMGQASGRCHSPSRAQIFVLFSGGL
jgi:hypothetical protein